MRIQIPKQRPVAFQALIHVLQFRLRTRVGPAANGCARRKCTFRGVFRYGVVFTMAEITAVVTAHLWFDRARFRT